jgi:ribose transport system substrate-binding protein
MKKNLLFIVFIVGTVVGINSKTVWSQNAVQEYKSQHEWSKAALYDPGKTKMVDTTKYKKKPPYNIAYANVANTNSFGVFTAAEFKARAEKYKAQGLINNIYITDAQNKPDKQISDIQDLVSKGIDLLVVRAATEAALDPIITKLHKEGLPIICISRRVLSDNFTSFLTAGLMPEGRIQAVWLAQYLKGKGNIVIVSGVPGAGPAVDRLAAAQEALSRYPGIKVLDTQYGYWQPGKGKQVMAAMIQAYGDKINGVLCDSGLQGQGALEALHEANMKVPITGDEVNGFLKRVQMWDYPACAVTFPPSLGADAVDYAVKILQGLPVPFEANTLSPVTTTVDTADVKADIPWSKFVRMDKSDDFWPFTDLQEDQLPK